MTLAIINGLITSILFETLILFRQMAFLTALGTALGMSLLSMLMMEATMNIVDIFITGGARITMFALPFMLVAGF